MNPWESGTKRSLLTTGRAEKVGVSRTSIYAELKRGQDGVTLDKNFRPAYDPALAQKRVQEGLRRRGRKADDMEKEEVENV